MNLRYVAVLAFLALAPWARSQQVVEPDRQGFQRVVFCERNHRDIFKRVRVTPLRSWVDGNSLLADIQIENRSTESVRFPGPGHGHFWDARLFDRNGEPVSYCGGVVIVDQDTAWRWHLLHENDLIVVPPRGTVILPAVYLAPFWPYLIPDLHVAAFEVTYSVNETELEIPENGLNAAQGELRETERLRESLYPGGFTSRRFPVPASPGN